MKKFLIPILVLTLTLVLCRSHSVSAAENHDEERVVRVATPGNYGPFTMYDETNKEWSGFEIELWSMIGKTSGYEIRFTRIDIPGAFAEVDLGRIRIFFFNMPSQCVGILHIMCPICVHYAEHREIFGGVAMPDMVRGIDRIAKLIQLLSKELVAMTVLYDAM